jgi:hypothetical protein
MGVFGTRGSIIQVKDTFKSNMKFVLVALILFLQILTLPNPWLTSFVTLLISTIFTNPRTYQNLFLSFSLNLTYFMGFLLLYSLMFKAISIDITLRTLNNVSALSLLFILYFVFRKTPPISVSQRNQIKQSILNQTDYVPTILFGSFIVFNYIRSGVGSLAFALSGDSRNHIWLAWFLNLNNGLDVNDLNWYPVFPNQVLAIFSNFGNVDKSFTRSALDSFFHSMGFVTALLMISISCLFAQIARIKLNDSISSTVSLFLAAVPFFGFYFGVSLADGFYSALFCIFLILLLLYFYLSTGKQNDKKSLFAILIACNLLTVLIAASWTIFVFIPLLLNFILVLKHFRMKKFLIFSLSSSFLSAYLSSQLYFSGLGNNLLKLSGSINALPIALAWFLGLCSFFLMLFWIFSKQYFYVQIIAPLLLMTLVVSYLSFIQNPGERWNYYPAKVAWVVFFVYFPIMFIDFLLILLIALNFVSRRFFKDAGVIFDTNFLRIVFLPIVFYLVIVVTLIPAKMFENNQIPRWNAIPNFKSWQAPSAQVVDTLSNPVSAVTKSSIIYWDYFDPSNDRLANFYSAMLSDADYSQKTWPNNVISSWAYTEVPGQIASLCELLEANDNKTTVIRTKNRDLLLQVDGRCNVDTNLVSVVYDD